MRCVTVFVEGTLYELPLKDTISRRSDGTITGVLV